ncbi:MAG: hypothetical protein QF805_02545, partial [Pirellulaceae bacterium]|nr:hypothetical protein [Pirellulaceae bacterium]
RPAVMPVVRPIVVNPVYRVPAPIIHEYFGGHWRYNGGSMKLTQVGNRVFGNAYSDDGRVSRIEGTATSRVLRFHWTRGSMHGEGVLYSTVTGVDGDINNKVTGESHSIHMVRR